MAIIPTGICIAPSAALCASSPAESRSSSEIALVNPSASGSTQICHPARVASTQSLRERVELDATIDCGKNVASLSHSSAIEKASLTFDTSFAPIGEEPFAVTHFFAVSRTIFLGSASVVAAKPGPFTPNFENSS